MRYLEEVFVGGVRADESSPGTSKGQVRDWF
jgi:hypothetical protein